MAGAMVSVGKVTPSVFTNEGPSFPSESLVGRTFNPPEFDACVEDRGLSSRSLLTCGSRQVQASWDVESAAVTSIGAVVRESGRHTPRKLLSRLSPVFEDEAIRPHDPFKIPPAAPPAWSSPPRPNADGVVENARDAVFR